MSRKPGGPTVRLQVPMTPELSQDVFDAAEALGESQSTFVRQALRSALRALSFQMGPKHPSYARLASRYLPHDPPPLRSESDDDTPPF